MIYDKKISVCISSIVRQSKLTRVKSLSMITKFSNLVQEMTLGYSRTDMILGVERSKVKVTGSISAFFTPIVGA